jgi:hypothetical protein
VRPLDEETILQSIKKTGHLVVADTSWELLRRRERDRGSGCREGIFRSEGAGAAHRARQLRRSRFLKARAGLLPEGVDDRTRCARDIGS